MTPLQRMALNAALAELKTAYTGSVCLFAKAGSGGREEEVTNHIYAAKEWLETVMRDGCDG